MYVKLCNNGHIYNCLSLSSGIIFQLESAVFELLSRLEEKMSRVIKSVGNIVHEEYPPPYNYNQNIWTINSNVM